MFGGVYDNTFGGREGDDDGEGDGEDMSDDICEGLRDSRCILIVFMGDSLGYVFV